jgi:hypothetical protein
MMLAGDRLRKRQGPGSHPWVFIDQEISGYELCTNAKLTPSCLFSFHRASIADDHGDRRC